MVRIAYRVMPPGTGGAPDTKDASARRRDPAGDAEAGRRASSRPPWPSSPRPPARRPPTSPRRRSTWPAHGVSGCPCPGTARPPCCGRHSRRSPPATSRSPAAMEPHLDARAILAESGAPSPPSTAAGASSRPRGPVSASWPRPTATPGCSTAPSPGAPWAARSRHALVTAWVDDTRRGLFAVDLGHDGVHELADAWHARGLRDIRSGPLRLDAVPATAVGDPAGTCGGTASPGAAWAWPRSGTAARWASPVASSARRGERTPDQVAHLHLGVVDTALTAARRDARSTRRTASTPATPPGRPAPCSRCGSATWSPTRVERVLTAADHALGPGPLALEPEHAARVADLRLYVRQHHAERDSAALGSSCSPTVARTEPPGDRRVHPRRRRHRRRGVAPPPVLGRRPRARPPQRRGPLHAAGGRRRPPRRREPRRRRPDRHGRGRRPRGVRRAPDRRRGLPPRLPHPEPARARDPAARRGRACARASSPPRRPWSSSAPATAAWPASRPR